MSRDVSKEEFDAAFAEEAAAAAFGRAPRRVTEADQELARTFGRPVPPLTKVAESREVEASEARTPEAELKELLEEFKDLRVSRRGEARGAACTEAERWRERINYHWSAPTSQRYRVQHKDRLRDLRETVESLRAEVPLSAGSAQGGAREGGVSVAEFDRAFASPRFAADGRRYTQVEADEAAARAFGRETKGDQQ